MSERRITLVAGLFSQHRASLQAFLRRRVRAAADVPDLAQEVYLRMLAVANPDAIRNPEHYLYTVASNLAKEHAVLDYRRAGEADVDDEKIQEQLAELPDMEAAVDGEQRVRRLIEVLGQLSPKCRAAVVLQYRHGLSYREIGLRLGVSSNMVKKYLAQALGKCRQHLSTLK